MRARENTSNANSHVSQNHPLTGIWEQQPDPSATTLVIYEISVRHGKSLVSAIDEGDWKRPENLSSQKG